MLHCNSVLTMYARTAWWEGELAMVRTLCLNSFENAIKQDPPSFDILIQPTLYAYFVKGGDIVYYNYCS